MRYTGWWQKLLTAHSSSKKQKIWTWNKWCYLLSINDNWLIIISQKQCITMEEKRDFTWWIALWLHVSLCTEVVKTKSIHTNPWIIRKMMTSMEHSPIFSSIQTSYKNSFRKTSLHLKISNQKGQNQVANRHMKRCTTWFVTKEMQIKTWMRYCCTPIRMTYNEKRLTVSRVASI